MIHATLQAPRRNLIAWLVLAAVPLASQAGEVELTIARANLNGGEVVDLIVELDYPPTGLALDLGRGKLYWSIVGQGGASTVLDGRIRRIDLDGSNIEDVVTQQRDIGGIALDSAAGKIYWVDYGTAKIQRANLDGSSIEELLVVHGFLQGMALDLQAGKMYWSNQNKLVQRANLDGSNLETLLVPPDHQFGNGIAVDPQHGFVFWSQLPSRQIWRMNLDGTGLFHVAGNGLDFPSGVAVDPVAQKVYWADSGNQQIERANYDGSERQVVLVRPADEIQLDVDGGRIYFSSAIGGAVVPALSAVGVGALTATMLLAATVFLLRRRPQRLLWTS